MLIGTMLPYSQITEMVDLLENNTLQIISVSFDLAHPLIKDNVGYITFSCVHAFYLASVAHTVVIFPNSSSTSLDQ